MKLHLLASAFVLVLAPVAAHAADDENPYKNAKVGDFANYKLTISVAGQNVEGAITQTVTAKSDKEVTLKVTGKANGLAIDSDMKVWLSKDIPGVLAKMETTMSVAGMKMEMKMELTETGNSK